MAQVPQEFNLTNAIRVKGHITRRTFSTYLIFVVALHFFFGYFVVAALGLGEVGSQSVYYLLGFLPASLLLINAELKRLRHIGVNIWPPITLLIIGITAIIPVFFDALPVVLFHVIVSAVLLAAPSYGSSAPITLKGFVYSKTESPDVFEVSKENGSKYIVRMQPHTSLRNSVGQDMKFENLSQEDAVRVTGYKTGEKTIKPSSVQVIHIG